MRIQIAVVLGNRSTDQLRECTGEFDTRRSSPHRDERKQLPSRVVVAFLFGALETAQDVIPKNDPLVHRLQRERELLGARNAEVPGDAPQGQHEKLVRNISP